MTKTPPLSSAALLVSVPFAITGAVHAVRALWPPVHDTSSAARHLVFVFINFFFAAAFARRARWIIFLTLVLAGQQIWSHGNAFLEAHRQGVFDGESVLVLCFFPLALLIGVMLARDDAGSSIPRS